MLSNTEKTARLLPSLLSESGAMGAQGGVGDHAAATAGSSLWWTTVGSEHHKKSPNTSKSLAIELSGLVHCLSYNPCNCPECSICFHCLA